MTRRYTVIFVVHCSGLDSGRAFYKGREAAGIQVLNNVSYIVISVLLLLFFVVFVTNG